MLRLQWQAFTEWLQDHDHCEESLIDSEIDEISQKNLNCRENVTVGETLNEEFQDVCKLMQKPQTLFQSFKAEGDLKSNLFAFWNSYISRVKILLDFIRSERTGNWLAHLSATAAMLPYFFAMDRPNYSKWIPIYLTDMRKLPDTHPKVHEEFMNGNHSVSRSGQSFSQVWTDMALEQSVNLDSKKHGGIIGITHKPGALERWFLTSHERAAITTATKEMCGLQDSDQIGTHKESSQNRMSRDEADVQKLISVFTSELMTNPFFLTQDTDSEVLPLLNIATGAVMPKDLTYNLIHAVDLGKSHMENFVEE